MKKIVLLLTFLLVPNFVFASQAADFIVNNQSIYDVPFSTSKVLVLDLTLPKPAAGKTLQLSSIKISSQDIYSKTAIAKLEIWEDGVSPGFNGDEKKVVSIVSSPFLDIDIGGEFRAYSATDSWARIFITIDTVHLTSGEKTITPRLSLNSLVFTDSAATGPTDKEIVGFTRKVIFNAQKPSVPVSPLAKKGEALSATAIRWSFVDLSNNEFGFKLIGKNFKELVRTEFPNISYIDETGLEPNQEYSGRSIVAYNDRGESLGTALTSFEAVSTLALPKEETQSEALVATTTNEEIKIVAEQEKIPTMESLRAQLEAMKQTLLEMLEKVKAMISNGTASLMRAFSEFLLPFLKK